MGNRESIQEKHNRFQRNIADQQQSGKSISTLILGSGSVGKSTIRKCVTHSYSIEGGFDQTHVNDTRNMSRSNTVYGINVLLKKTAELYGIEEFNKRMDDNWKTLVDTIHESRKLNFDIEEKLDYDQLKILGEAIDIIWNLDKIQQTFKDRLCKKYAFVDNMDYFYNKIKHVMSKQYKPEIDDILKVRIRTTGCLDVQYKDYSNGITFLFRDVGGERGERKKWIHVMHGIECVLYVCALNQYCLAMYEDENVLGLNENLILWNEISKHESLKHCKFVVLLNKTDLFRESLAYTPLTYCFGDEYKGRNYNDMHPNKTVVIKRVIIELLFENDVDLNCSDDIAGIVSIYCDEQYNWSIYEYWLDLVYQDCVEFIKQKFLSIKKDIAIYEVCSIYPDQVKIIIEDIKTALIQNK